MSTPTEKIAALHRRMGTTDLWNASTVSEVIETDVLAISTIRKVNVEPGDRHVAVGDGLTALAAKETRWCVSSRDTIAWLRALS